MNVRGPRAPLVRTVRTLAVVAGLTIGASLVAFHAWLLWLRASGGSILDAGVGLRWALSALLLGAVVGLRRLGRSPFQGRRAVVFWVLVAVLHWSAEAPGTRAGELGSEAAAETLLLLPSATAALAAGAALALIVSGRGRRPAPPVFSSLRAPLAYAAPLRSAWGLGLAARPPPA